MVQNAMRAVCPGRDPHAAAQAKIGSSTVPTVFDSGRPSMHRDRGPDAAAAAEKARAVGFELALCRRPRRRRRRDAPPRPPARPASAAAASPAWRRRSATILGLHEQLGEGRMRDVGRRRRQHELGIGGDFDLARVAAAVGDRDAADLGIVFGRDQDLQTRRQRSVAPGELGAVLGEGDLDSESGSTPLGWKPADQTLPLRDVAQEDVGAPIVAGGVLAPARDRQVAPAAVARAGGGDHHGVAAVRQQMRARRARRAGWSSAPAAGGRDVADRGGRLRLRAPRAAPPRRRAACAPAAAARSPARSARRESAPASRRPAARWRWRRWSCPGDAPCRRARSATRLPSGSRARRVSRAPRRSRKRPRAAGLEPALEVARRRRADRPWPRARSRRAR